MKKDIHPQLNRIEHSCSTCNTKHKLLTTAKDVTIDVCSGCHAFFTGDSQVVKATGRIERFNRRAAGQKTSK